MRTEPKRQGKKTRNNLTDANSTLPLAEATISSRKTYPAFLFPSQLDYDPTQPDRGFLMGEPVRNVRLLSQSR